MFDTNVVVELFWNASDGKYFDRISRMMQVIGMSLPLNCKCSYDREMLSLVKTQNGIEIEPLKPCKGIRIVGWQEVDIIIDQDSTFKELLKLSNNHDALLIITSETCKSELLINDNGHDFIYFDKNEYDIKDVKEKFKQILKK
jgi:hypothetical protein